MIVGPSFEDRRAHGIAGAAWPAAPAVIVRGELAPLCFPDPAVEGARGLRHYGLVARPAAPAGAAAAPVEEPQLHAVLAGNGGEVSLGLVQGPVTRHIAGVLAGIAVAEHDLLQVATLGQRGAVEGVLEQATQHLGGSLQVVDALEERRDPDLICRAPAALVNLQQPGQAREEQYTQDVARLVGHAQDKGLYRRLREGIRGLPDAIE